MTKGSAQPEIVDRVTVAVRELHDSLYRSFRTGGARAGLAEGLTTAAVFSIGHLGASLDRWIELLEADRLPTFGLPYVLRAETSHDPVVVPDGSVLADFAYFAVTAGAKRGTLLRSDDGEGSLSSPLEWFANPQPEQPVKTLQRLPDQHGSTRMQQRNFDDEAAALQRSGFSLDRATWGRLEALAKRYLVSESEIDRAVDPLG